LRNQIINKLIGAEIAKKQYWHKGLLYSSDITDAAAAIEPLLPATSRLDKQHTANG